MESIRKTVDVVATQPEVLELKTFGKAIFVVDLAPTTEDDRLLKFGSYAEVVDAMGSNSEAEKFAKSYFQNKAYGGTPKHMWIYKVDIATEDLAEKIREVMRLPEDFYFFTCEEDFTTANKVIIAEQIELYTDNWYSCIFEYTDAEAYNPSSTTDLTYLLDGKNKSVVCFAPKVGGNNEYLSGALAGKMSGVEFTESQGKYEPAKKEFAGITPNGLTDAQLTALADKNYNYYTATTTFKDNDWLGLNSRNCAGNPFIDYQAQDYMSYNITAKIVTLLKNTSIIGFDRDGLNLIENALTSEMTRYGVGDILSLEGVASDGELFPNGFKISMPNLANITPAEKISGDLSGIVITYLPKYSITKLTIQLNATI